MLRLRQDPPDIGGATLPNDPDGRCEADVLIVGGDATPGLVTVSKAGQIFMWDKRKGYGYSGAWLIFTGEDLSEFDTTITIWRLDQRQAWTVWAKKYLTKPPVQPQQSTGPSLAARQQAQTIAANAQTQAAAQTDPAVKNQILTTAQNQVNALLQGSSTTGYVPNIPKPKALGVSNPILAELGIKAIVPKHIGQWVPGAGQSKGRWTKTINWYQWKPPTPRLGRPDGPISDVKKNAPVAQDPQQLQIRSKLQDVQARKDRVAQLQGLK